MLLVYCMHVLYGTILFLVKFSFCAFLLMSAMYLVKKRLFITTATFGFCSTGVLFFSRRSVQIRPGPRSSSREEPLWIVGVNLFTGCMPFLSLSHQSQSAAVTVDLIIPRPQARALSYDARLTSDVVRLSRTSGLTREQRGLGRLKLAQR